MNIRHPQLSLRAMAITVAVVGLFMGWLVSEAKFVCDRKAFLDRIRGADYVPVSLTYFPGDPIPVVKISFWRHWLGDAEEYVVILPAESTDKDLDVAKKLFAEALLVERADPAHQKPKISYEVRQDESGASIHSMVWVDTRWKREPMLSIQVLAPDHVELMTGFTRGPLDGGGHTVTLKKVNGTWVVVNVGWWVS